MPTPSKQRLAYWQRTRWLTLALLGLWAVVTFVPAWWARELNEMTLFGWPVGFYMGAQGSLIVYVLIVGLYAQVMDRLDRRYSVEERPSSAAPGAQGSDDA